jgi:hypothetical protein
MCTVSVSLLSTPYSLAGSSSTIPLFFKKIKNNFI